MTQHPERLAHVRDVRRPVIKIGSGVLTARKGRLDREIFASFVAGIARLHERGARPIIVSSGAIAMGIERLQLDRRPESLTEKQALAAIGQSRLMHLYDAELSSYGITCAQILLTHEDIRNRERFLNARHTLSALLDHGVVPIINENDTVAVEEIKLGDNDNLSAQVCNLAGADLLVILTELEGLYDKDPRSNADAQLISTVTAVDAGVRALVGESRSAAGTGGMATKLDAVAAVTRAGIPAIVASGRRHRVLDSVLAGELTGTLFLPHARKLVSRKGWIAFSLKARGRVHVDAGAVAAIRERGKSLLPKGIVQVEGPFHKGDPVDVLGPGGERVARGLCSYSSEELARIAGLGSAHIAATLGYGGPEEAIHRDDLALL